MSFLYPLYPDLHHKINFLAWSDKKPSPHRDKAAAWLPPSPPITPLPPVFLGCQITQDGNGNSQETPLCLSVWVQVTTKRQWLRLENTLLLLLIPPLHQHHLTVSVLTPLSKKQPKITHYPHLMWDTHTMQLKLSHHGQTHLCCLFCPVYYHPILITVMSALLQLSVMICWSDYCHLPVSRLDSAASPSALVLLFYFFLIK